MIYLVIAVAIVVGVWSLTLSMAVLAHLTVLAACAVPLWAADILHRPYSPCKYCDRGRSWDSAGEHYGLFCPGWYFGLFSCHRVGRKLRWELRLLRCFGVGHGIADPVREAKIEQER